MEHLASLLASPAGVAALLATVTWAPVTGFSTWPAFSRGRVASTLAASLAVSSLVFFSVQRLSALGPG